METEVQARPLLKILREFIKERCINEDEVITSEMVAAAVEYFADDPEFQMAAVRDVIPAVLPGELAEYLHYQRERFRATANGAVSHDAENLNVRNRLASVFENIGGRYRTVLSMTRPQHLLIAEDRESWAAGHLRWAGFHRDIAAKHVDDIRETGDCLTTSELDSLWRKHFETHD